MCDTRIKRVIKVWYFVQSELFFNHFLTYGFMSNQYPSDVFIVGWISIQHKFHFLLSTRLILFQIHTSSLKHILLIIYCLFIMMYDFEHFVIFCNYNNTDELKIAVIKIDTICVKLNYLWFILNPPMVGSYSVTRVYTRETETDAVVHAEGPAYTPRNGQNSELTMPDANLL